jgi:hypothetical protein
MVGKAVLASLLSLLLLTRILRGDEPAPVNRQDFPTFGVSVEAPSGWPRIPETQPNEAAAWGLAKSDDPTQPEVRLSVLYYDAVNTTLQASANNLAKNSHGRVVDSDVKIAGLDTRKIVPQTAGDTNCSAYVCKRGQKEGFVVECRWAGSSAHEAEFKKFAESVRLGTVQPPVKHLTIRLQPVPILGTKAIFNFIEPMRVLRENKEKQRTTYLVRDYAAGRNELNVVVTAREKPADKPLSEYLDRLGGSFAEAYRHDKPKFTQVKAKAEVWISPLMKVTGASATGERTEGGEKSESGDRPTHFRHIVAAAGSGEIIHFSCPINVREPEAAEEYSRMIEKMAETIRPKPAAGATEDTGGKASQKDASKPSSRKSLSRP